MGPYQRLQCADAGLCLEHDTAAPLARHVEVTHAQRNHDRTDREGAQYERTVWVVENDALPQYAHQLPGQLRKQQAESSQDHKAEHKRLRLAGTFEPVAQLAQQRRPEQCQPQSEQRGLGQRDQELTVASMGGKRQHDGNQLGDQHDDQQRTGRAKVRQESLVGLSVRFGGVRQPGAPSISGRHCNAHRHAAPS